ncbi:PO113 protein, partial [Ptilonorhynchus violaceus]|nr:PO113 protein [Ptilonorhynchus violaceus]
DAPRFAFLVPSINREAPMRRCHWPDQLNNMPVVCCSHSVPSPKTCSQGIIFHYMDDVLVCAPTQKYLDWSLEKVIKALEMEGFEIQMEMVQKTCPWKYLGLVISERTIVPQGVVINDNPQTLQKLHQLCGTINWIRSLLGLTKKDLTPLFSLLKGGCELNSLRTLTAETRESIKKVQQALSSTQVHRCRPNLPFRFAILGDMPYLHGLIFQWDEVQRDPLLLIEWVFLSHQLSKSIAKPQELMARLIMKARARLRALAGCDFMCIYM